MKVLTAGTSGFVSRRLCPVLAAAGHHVVAMTRTRSATLGELVRATGLGKATVYRLYPTKDALVAAYLRRLAATIGAAIVSYSAGASRRERGAGEVVATTASRSRNDHMSRGLAAASHPGSGS